MEANTEGGAAIQGDAKAGKNLTGRDSHTERQTQRAGDNYFNTAGENQQIWFKILDIANEINALTRQIQDLLRRMDNMERTEVVVRPGPEVRIRPIGKEPVSINLPMSIVLAILVVAVLVAVTIAVVLFMLRVQNG